MGMGASRLNAVSRHRDFGLESGATHFFRKRGRVHACFGTLTCLLVALVAGTLSLTACHRVPSQPPGPSELVTAIEAARAKLQSGATMPVAIGTPGAKTVTWVVSSPYGLTDAWLEANTTLRAGERWKLRRACDDIENVLIAKIDGSDVVSIEWLAPIFGFKGSLVLRPADRLEMKEVESPRRYLLMMPMHERGL